jgi:hypothetical protein
MPSLQPASVAIIPRDGTASVMPLPGPDEVRSVLACLEERTRDVEVFVVDPGTGRRAVNTAFLAILRRELAKTVAQSHA